MQISDLNTSGTFSGSDVLAIEVNGTTYKLNGNTLAAALKTIGNYLSTSNLPLQVTSGGTGLTASPSLLVNLASTDAANIMAAAPRPGITGILPVENGGTGRSTEIVMNLSFSANDNSWSAIYNILSKLSNNQSAFYVASGTPVTMLTNSKLSFVIKGMVNRVNDGVYDFFAYTGYQPQTIYVWRINGLTSASATPTFGNVCRYDGTVI